MRFDEKRCLQKIKEGRLRLKNPSKDIKLKNPFIDTLQKYFKIYEFWPEDMQKDPELILFGLLDSKDESNLVECIKKLNEKNLFSINEDCLELMSSNLDLTVYCYREIAILHETTREKENSPIGMTSSPLLYIPQLFRITTPYMHTIGVNKSSELPSELETKVFNATFNSASIQCRYEEDRVKYRRVFNSSNFDCISVGNIQDYARKKRKNFIILTKK
ncbi:MAG: hypothetical protein ABIH42_01605 [Planctomycetota bacterium]